MWYNEVMKRKLLGLLALSIVAINFLIVAPVWATPSATDCSKLGGTWSAGSSGWVCSGAKSSNSWSSSPTPSAANCYAFGGTWSAGSSGWVCSGATFSGSWTTTSSGGNTTTVNPSTTSGSGSGSNTSTGSGGGGGAVSGVVTHGAGGSAGQCTAGGTTITFAILPIEGNPDCKDAIFQALGIGLSILTWGVSIGATIGFVITAYQYITAGSNVAQVQKAKMRMVQIVIGIVFYATFWGVMNWLLPGGLFGDGSI